MNGYSVDVSRPKARDTGVEFDVFSSTDRVRAHVSYETLGADRATRSATDWEALVRGIPDKLQKLVDQAQRNGSCGPTVCTM